MLKLVQIAPGVFDLDLSTGTADEDAATLVYATLFTDARAPASDVPDAYLRRGWWFDETAGTGLWYVRRKALSDGVRRECVAMVKQALQQKAPALQNVQVQEVVTDTTKDPRNISRVSIIVTATHNGKNIIMRTEL